MVSEEEPAVPGAWIRRSARILGSLWACWWVFFETAEGLGSGRFGSAILFAAVMFGSVAIAWRWPRAGGVTLILISATSLLLFGKMWLHRFDLPQVLVLFLLMSAPPLLSGILFLVSGRIRSVTVAD